jgi:hypothetical protein
MKKTLLIFLLLVLSLLAAAQEAQSSIPCIATDETIYKPGVDGVKPPQPQPDKSKKSPDIRSPMSFELLVNSQGHVCSVKVVSARDQVSAKRVADYIAEHWSFKPATRQSKPVAVSFNTNLNPEM